MKGAVAFTAGLIAIGVAAGIGMRRTAHDLTAVQPHAMSLAVPLDRSHSTAPPAGGVTPVMAKEHEILSRNAHAVSDPELAAQFAEINDAHFRRQLPEVTVAWEAALAEVGTLIGHGFSLEGLTDGRVILLNPALRDDAKALQRALCHEMVHVYLASIGIDKTSHGAEFQQTLRRLSDEGAFEGIPSSDVEKADLRRALEESSARLDRENTELTAMRQQIDAERQQLDDTIAELNARIVGANSQPPATPNGAEREAVERFREQLNERVNDYNARIARQKEGVAAFNGDVERYKLMAAYPDGLDGEAMIAPKTSPVVSASSRTAAR